MFSQKHGPQMDQKQTRVLTIGCFEHTALCKFEKRVSRTFAFYLCESRLPRNFFHITGTKYELFHILHIKKLLLGAMNNKKRYNRPLQLQVNVTRTMAILRYEDHNLGFVVVKGKGTLLGPDN